MWLVKFVWMLSVRMILFTSDKEGGICFRPHARVRLSVCLSIGLCARLGLLRNACMDLDKCWLSTDVRTWTNWLTFEPDPDYSPDAGTGLLPPISYRLRNIAALPSLAYFSDNLAYFSAFSVSICAKLTRSILMRDRNTAKEPNFRKSLFKCRISSPKNSYLSISHVNSSTAPTLLLVSIDQ